MTEENADDHASMIIYRTKLISRSTAIAIGEGILRDLFGEEEFRRQLPLVAVEDGSTWAVSGGVPRRSSKDFFENVTENGQFCLVLSQVDGRISRVSFDS